MQHAPQQLAEIGLNPNDFQYSDKKSWRGPCPHCGGSRRFVMFTDHEWPLWNGYCDQCGATIKAWQKVRVQYDPARYAAFQAEREAEEAQRIARRKEKLAEWSNKDLQDELHARLTAEHIDLLESWGIPQGVQEYLRIGFTPDKAYYNKERELLHSPAYTFPWFNSGFEFKTMQYRLTNDTDRRYIFEDGLGGGQHYYMTEPDKPIGDKVIICEGAKKAIVTQFWLTEGFTVLAASSANTFDAALEATKDCGLRYVIFDPSPKDFYVRKAVMTNPNTTHAVRLPYKIDDGWAKYGLDRETFMRTLAGAI